MMLESLQTLSNPTLPAMWVLGKARHPRTVIHAIGGGGVEVRAVALPRRLHLLIACVFEVGEGDTVGL